MACPYFCPHKPLPWSLWQGNLRPPLGELYQGECQAPGAQSFHPSEPLLSEACNLGYAGAECALFAAGAGPDAVRFSIAAEEETEIRIQFVIEKGHLPWRHGVLRFDRQGKTWAGMDLGSLLQSQAQAYLDAYLRWKEEG